MSIERGKDRYQDYIKVEQIMSSSGDRLRGSYPLASGFKVPQSRGISEPITRSMLKVNDTPVQAGCSTIGAGGYRNKVSLEPGHSALDWNDLCESSGVKGEMVSGLSKHLSDPNDELFMINHGNSLRQLSEGVPTFKLMPPLMITKKMVAKHKDIDDCWCIIRGKVYSISNYFKFHPGGDKILINQCSGRDCTKAFDQYHRWVNVERLLETCFVGNLI
ncbi:hypothetical protein Kpol_348p12 [Vanderwaltozyma polyspora DSM 70294]|uniref:Cytochrome b5 heme-binding domain-containing protein n=1 Tax=Vanderwaltozyma polyspora (strain ATCC 22028 / DSM 70294 / BCRC 21397 / CBS 2163 / NBRC 10782 / NRRL Y-8283 / UCD 57-17) TaxID=436907 RepID=A7TS58_VANPO|nr:uncharacterized protein Kpol_348p12 [Vanderwaltozyma polyspora DSM 70294]EDO14908.1 hypothetical protein Kpol_348p12 [Vanderwaltozyma polyspora DSM 70294]